ADTTGREYLDFQSGQMGAALGHRHPRVMRAIEEATRTIVHASNTMLNLPRLQLHERLGGLLTPPLPQALLLVGGPAPTPAPPPAAAPCSDAPRGRPARLRPPPARCPPAGTATSMPRSLRAPPRSSPRTAIAARWLPPSPDAIFCA